MQLNFLNSTWQYTPFCGSENLDWILYAFRGGTPGGAASGGRLREEWYKRGYSGRGDGGGGSHALVIGSLQNTVVLPEGCVVLCQGGHH